ncbi:MAG TPA: pantoate--beta-alanine ligase [Rhizomicrobium sp.]|nr:pantoate--beta-alanine ligase [Rhizomicrobium sp.]
MTTPRIVHTISDLRAQVNAWRTDSARIGLVPTMGALHEGHLSLVRETQTRCDKVIASIFVNPAQFAPHEDFDRYPRTLESDTQKLGGVGLDLIFAPSVGEMYPAGFATRLEVGGPSAGLETDFRPHFFSGVATVVSKLLIAAMPDVAIFGEKDYQQLLVIRRMTADLGLPIEILGAAIVREPDGLAMSSRNAYLRPDERKAAGKLNVILRDAIAALLKGAPIADAEAAAAKAIIQAGFNSVDYVAVRDAATLAKIETLDRPARILVAAKIGGTRLIDNMAV